MEAQKRLADIYYNGESVPQDYTAAAHWYKRAAEQGDNYSHHSLGICYQAARGVARDDALAFSHFEKAVQGPKKIVSAHRSLAICYEFGRGTPMEWEQAASHYRQAADAGLPEAKVDLGILLAEGKGVDRDPVGAVRLFAEAAGYGHLEATFQLGTAFLTGNGLRQAPELGIGAYLKACPALTQEASDGTPPVKGSSRNAAMALGLRHLIGRDVPEDPDRATRCLLMAKQLEMSPQRIDDLLRLLSESHGRLPACPPPYDVLIKRKRLSRLLHGLTGDAAFRDPNESVSTDPDAQKARDAELESALKLPGALTAISHRLWVEASLAHLERDRLAPLWFAALAISQARLHAHSYQAYVDSSLRLGPVYNKLDHQGCPLPSILKQRTWPQDGWVQITGISESHGTLKLQGKRSSHHPSLITPEDFEVAQILAFASEDRIEWPSFSLEDATGTHEPWMRLQKKVFTPSWLAATDFGHSLYQADWMLKSLREDSVLQSYTDPFLNTASTPGAPVHEYMRRHFPVQGDSVPGCSFGRLELVMTGIKVSTQKRAGGFLGTLYNLEDFHIHIESSGIKVDEHGNELDRNLQPDDPTTFFGQVAMRIKQNYALVCHWYPVFARVPQILAVARLLFHLRQQGVMPPASQLKHLRKLRTQYIDATAKQATQLVPRFPSERDVHSVGGVSMKNSTVDEVPPGGGGGGGFGGGSGGDRERHGIHGMMDDLIMSKDHSTQNLELRGVLDELFRPNAKIGDGSTEDAIFNELRTQEPTKWTNSEGKEKESWHFHKGEGKANELQKLVNYSRDCLKSESNIDPARPPLKTPNEFAVADYVIEQLRLANHVWLEQFFPPKKGDPLRPKS